jgi:hypothetical protein
MLHLRVQECVDMNANKTLSRLLALGAIIASLGLVPRAFAIDPAHLVQEGNANCSDYGSNKLIFEIDDSSLTYSPSEETISDGKVEVTYTIHDEVLTFHDARYVADHAPAGINVAILRGDQNKAETFMWGTNEGVPRWPPYTGSSVDLTVTSPQTSIETISLCYGLGLGETGIPPMPACLDDLLEACPDSAAEAESTFISYISEGEHHYCCCPPQDGSTPDEPYCHPDTGLEGCILGAPVEDGGCGEIEFSHLEAGDVIVSGSPTCVCSPSSTGYTCWGTGCK